MKKNLLKRTFITASIGFIVPAIAVAADGISDNNPWKISAGMSYAMLNAANTSGDIALTGGTSHYLARNSNLAYQNAWAPGIEFDRDIGSYITVGLAYEYLNSKITTSTLIPESAINQTGSYASNLRINTFLFKTYLKWPDAFSVGSMSTSPFIGAGLGAANLAMSNQQSDTASGVLLNPLVNNTVWQFAFSAEVGAETAWTPNWSLSYGIKYTNYGKFNSGTAATDASQNIIKSVQANVYAFAPFLNLGYRF